MSSIQHCRANAFMCILLIIEVTIQSRIVGIVLGVLGDGRRGRMGIR